MDHLSFFFPDFISSAVRFHGFVSQSSLGIGWLRRLSPLRRVGFGEIVFNFSMPLDKLKNPLAPEGFRSPYTFMRARSKEGLPVTCAKDYSYLKATIGSTRIARRAGM